jgi:hypothetical protein
MVQRPTPLTRSAGWGRLAVHQAEGASHDSQ